METFIVDVPLEGLREEEQLAIVLKASVDTVLEEQMAHVASFIYDRAPGSLLVSFFFLFLFSLSGVVILMFLLLLLLCLQGVAPW